jgi:hypothetical protein
VDLVLSCVFGGIERQFWGVLLRRWIDIHDSGFPNVVQLFVHPKGLGHAVEVLVAVF